MGPRGSVGLSSPFSAQPRQQWGSKPLGLSQVKAQHGISLVTAGWKCHPAGHAPPWMRHKQAGTFPAEMAAAVPLFESAFSCGICHPVPTGSSGSDAGRLPDVGSWEYPAPGNNKGQGNAPSTASASWLRHAVHLVILSAGQGWKRNELEGKSMTKTNGMV